MINQVTLEDGYFFLGDVIVTFLSHGLPSVYDGLSQTGQKSYSR
jgi:hypothetical protein